MTTLDGRRFDAPGPGAWELEAAHFPRPLTHFVQKAFVDGFREGFEEGTARYSLTLKTMKMVPVHGFIYAQAVPFGAPEGAKGPPPKLVFQALTRLLPSMRRRLRASQEALDRKLWREDLRSWDQVVKPAAIAAHRAIQAIDPSPLDDDALARHVEDCFAHARRMVRQHHQFTISCCVPVGDFLAHVTEWTKRPAGEILALLKGSSRISRGAAATELEALAAAIRESEAARAILSSGRAAREILDALTASADPLGAAARAYLEIVEHRCLGYDVADACAGELPDVLVRAIRSAVEGIKSNDEEGVRARIAELRSRVPAEHRSAFDELLEEARHINRLRDERGHYSDGWATGLARRAVIEAGRRLHRRGKVGAPEHAVDLTCEEMSSLLRGGAGPRPEAVDERVRWRLGKSIADAPPWLGAPPSPPPPAEWLPLFGRRSAKAVGSFLEAMWTEAKPEVTSRSVKGLPVSPGVHEGVARVVSHEHEFVRIQQGDVLVTRATSPYFNVVLPLLGAIVTDRGGQLCHAAIVSREYGIPGVVGTKEATSVIKEGDRVRVNGTTGDVEVLA